jgi:P-type Ca2+ transporter type 2C
LSVISKEVVQFIADKTPLERQLEQLAGEGFRVLAVATKTGKQLTLKHLKDVNSLEFTGLFVFSDTLRHDASNAIKKCQDAGIQVIMITGDHLNTAVTIAKQAHLYTQNAVAVIGDKLEKFIAKAGSLSTLRVVARANPFHKSALIDKLKSEHKLVAMTGDGVNDTPALVKILALPWESPELMLLARQRI